ncbi:nucleotidyltransferase domain-containing protein [Burkholderia cenocepacia]|uniref:nucleotidyltransferase domain-containing protein n=1 Tax=Burkholderia cenocepacia TaxID=95486 RepID=UPI00209AA2A0|nr:nucleotidyltransferase [Burkholderia cenocepacia]
MSTPALTISSLGGGREEGHGATSQVPQRRPFFSYRAETQFFHLADTIARSHEPTSTQLLALESSYISTAEYLAESDEFAGLTTNIHGHGSRALGTLLRPSDESREGFDIDLVARLDQRAMSRYGGDGGPGLLINHLHAVLSRYASAHNLKVKRWERCVTLEYAGGMFADITPVVGDPLSWAAYGDTHGRVPDRQLRTYEPTNPRGLTRSFAQAAAIAPVFTAVKHLIFAADSVRKSISPLPKADEVFERLLSRLVQLLKLHRNVAFGKATTGHQDFAPSSVFITTLAAAAYVDLAPKPHSTPLDLLLDIVEAMPQYFTRERDFGGGEVWYLQNPSSPYDNLASSMNTRERQGAFDQWHARICRDLRMLVDVIETNAGLDAVVRVVAAVFGERARAEILRDDRARREADRKAGRVAILGGGAAPSSVIARSKPHTFYGD